jgi:hypothetical protein
MDARSSESGFDTPHTRQRFAPCFTSAPHRLQAKTKIVSPAGKLYLSSDKHPAGEINPEPCGEMQAFFTCRIEYRPA